MKKLAFMLMSLSALVFASGATAHAQSVPYGDADAGTATISPLNPAPGGVVTITVTGCAPGEVLTHAMDGAVLGTTTCVGSGELAESGELDAAVGSSTFRFEAPTAPGTYMITITGDQGFARTIALVVAAPATTPSGALPSTGSGGIGTAAWLAAGFLVVGIGLFLVARNRRRHASVSSA